MNNEILEKVLNSSRNLIVEGEALSGKTTNVLFPVVNDIIDKKESLFILDSKEEYLNQYYDKLNENNYNIVILNLNNMDKSEGWNPLEYPYNLFKNNNEDKAQKYLEKMGRTLFYDDFLQDQFWSLTASDFFTGVALGLFEDGKPEEINFNSISNMFNGIDKKCGTSDYITYYFKSKDNISDPYVLASTTILAPKETKGGILTLARQKLRLFVSMEKLSSLLNKTTFKVEDIVNKPTVIFLINSEETKYLNILTTIFIEQLCMMLTDLKNNNIFNFILDNFDITQKWNDLIDTLNSSLSKKIKLYIATCSFDELNDKYGKQLLKLCDLISINNENLKVNIDSSEEIFEKEFNNITIKETNVEYPILDINQVQLFDMEKFMIEHGLIKKQDLNVEDLIKNIDEKIKQLDLMENEKKFKSELEQFKIKD